MISLNCLLRSRCKSTHNQSDVMDKWEHLNLTEKIYFLNITFFLAHERNWFEEFILVPRAAAPCSCTCCVYVFSPCVQDDLHPACVSGSLDTCVSSISFIDANDNQVRERVSWT